MSPLFIAALLSAALLPVAGCSASRAYYRYGHSLAESEPSVGGCSLAAGAGSAMSNRLNIRGTTGDELLDNAVKQEAFELRTVFGVWPGLTYFVEPPEVGKNAYATPDKLFMDEQDGTVLLGLNLITAEQNEPDWGAALNGVLAHEYAHIVQQQQPRLRRMPTPWKELQADFLAGWYLGIRALSLGLPIPIEGFGRALQRMGDFAFHQPDHHGTPVQRETMMYEGYVFAREAVNADLDNAIEHSATLLSFRGTSIVVVPTR